MTLAIETSAHCFDVATIGFLVLRAVATAALAAVVYILPLNCNDFVQHLFYYETDSFSRTLDRLFL
jgi:hypothetical protein